MNHDLTLTDYLVKEKNIGRIHHRKARFRALVQSIGAIIFSFITGIIFGKATLGVALFTLAILILIVGLRFPDVLEKFTQKLINFTSTFLSWVLLTPCFYFLCVPVRVVALLKHHDPLARSVCGKQESYWKIPVDVAFPLNNFKRQY